MRLVVDTNVFLDVILRREPLCHASARILDLSQRGCELLMPAHSASTILYIVEKQCDRQTALTAFSNCLSVAHVAALDETTILKGLALDFKDPEDSFVAAIAQREQADAIVTNNVTDFAASPVKALTPAEFLAALQATGKTDDE